MKRKQKKLAKQIGLGAGIVGGVVAAGYAATRLINRSHEEKSLNQSVRDADRAGDFEPGSNFELLPGRHDAVSDPLGRTSSELPVEGER
jgi:hypothetical protein